MNRIRIGFLGYGTRALDFLMEHPLFDVRYFLAPRSRLCQEVYDAQGRYDRKLTMEIIEDGEQLGKRFAQIDDVECFLMNACPIILDRRALSQMKVFNIHPGDLRYNRGHQPHCWTVLLGEKQTKIVLHRVDEEIDSGSVVKSVDVKVSATDSAGDVLNHAEDKIPILLDALYQHLTEHAEYEGTVKNGGYRRVMTYRDYEIGIEMDTEEQIRRKILSRSMHHGAFFYYGSERVYVDRLLSYGEDVNERAFVRIEEQRRLVYVYLPCRSMVFRLNKIEK